MPRPTVIAAATYVVLQTPTIGLHASHGKHKVLPLNVVDKSAPKPSAAL